MRVRMIYTYKIILFILLLTSYCNSKQQNDPLKDSQKDPGIRVVDDPGFNRSTGEFIADKYTGALWHFNTLSVATLDDASGHQNFGDVHNAQLTDQGRFGKAYKFDGKSSYIQFDHTPGISPKYGITVEFWAYVETNQFGQGFAAFVSKDSTFQGSGQPSYEFYLNNVPDNEYRYNLVWRINTDSGEFELPANDTEWNWKKHLSDQKWHYLAATFDGEEMKLYIDGQLKNSRKIKKSHLFQTNRPLRISRKYGEANFINGNIDEMRISIVARSEKAIKAYWNATQTK
ncbi:MAG: hypothetical protein IEMM0008_0969 [bacterium]|nr:MAG: hypothetical protein IEMM0008_0969 [bacterium]